MTTAIEADDSSGRSSVFLRCDQTASCEGDVTHIDDKGWLYCTPHGEGRRSVRPCRRMTEAEIATLTAGKTIWWDAEKNLPEEAP
jgi:hypothetical protein